MDLLRIEISVSFIWMSIEQTLKRVNKEEYCSEGMSQCTQENILHNEYVWPFILKNFVQLINVEIL